MKSPLGAVDGWSKALKERIDYNQKVRGLPQKPGYGDWGPGFDSRRRLFMKKERFSEGKCLHTDFSTSVSVTATLDVRLFLLKLSLSFPEQLASITLNLFLPSLPLELFLLKLCKGNKWPLFCLCSVSVHSHCLCWDSAIRMKLVLLVSSGGRKKYANHCAMLPPFMLPWLVEQLRTFFRSDFLHSHFYRDTIFCSKIWLRRPCLCLAQN